MQSPIAVLLLIVVMVSMLYSFSQLIQIKMDLKNNRLNFKAILRFILALSLCLGLASFMMNNTKMLGIKVTQPNKPYNDTKVTK